MNAFSHKILSWVATPITAWSYCWLKLKVPRFKKELEKYIKELDKIKSFRVISYTNSVKLSQINQECFFDDNYDFGLESPEGHREPSPELKSLCVALDIKEHEVHDLTREIYQLAGSCFKHEGKPVIVLNEGQIKVSFKFDTMKTSKRIALLRVLYRLFPSLIPDNNI